MKSKIMFLLNRAKYAAIGAAIGAGLGGLVSRNAASTGGAMGAMAGAVIAETRASAGTTYTRVKEKVKRE